MNASLPDTPDSGAGSSAREARMVRHYRMLDDGDYRFRQQGAKALRHGLFTRALRFETLGELRAFRRLRAELKRETGPSGTIEYTLLDQMAVALWRMRRALAAEREGGELSARAHARISSLDRQFHRAWEALKKARGQSAAARHYALFAEFLDMRRGRAREARR